jgi:hypothetical protein
VTAALVPEVAGARDHVRSSRGPRLLIFGDYECPYTRIAYRSVQSLEAEGVPSCFPYHGSFEPAELRRMRAPNGEENE